MPVIELDMLIAFVSAADSLHDDADRLFQQIRDGRLTRVRVATSALLEYELLLRSRGVEDAEIAEDVLAYSTYPNLAEEPLDSNKLVLAQQLRDQYRLTYFDSLHCAAALLFDRTIIGTDSAYDAVAQIRRTDPRTLLQGKKP
jgi:predicted nucleic acid-binding protein